MIFKHILVYFASILFFKLLCCLVLCNSDLQSIESYSTSLSGFDMLNPYVVKDLVSWSTKPESLQLDNSMVSSTIPESSLNECSIVYVEIESKVIAWFILSVDLSYTMRLLETNMLLAKLNMTSVQFLMSYKICHIWLNKDNDPFICRVCFQTNIIYNLSTLWFVQFYTGYHCVLS